MTDNVSDAQFEEALAEAKAERNLSRANVARKAKARSAKPVIDPDDPLIDADTEPPPEPIPETPKKRLTKHNSTEMLANINGMLNGIVETIPFITPSEIDISEETNRQVVENLRESLTKLRKLLKEIQHG